MLKMKEINVINHKYENEGKSPIAIADDLGYSPNTVRKYLGIDDWNAVKPQKRDRKQPILGPFKPTIDDWLTGFPRKFICVGGLTPI